MQEQDHLETMRAELRELGLSEAQVEKRVQRLLEINEACEHIHR